MAEPPKHKPPPQPSVKAVPIEEAAIKGVPTPAPSNLSTISRSSASTAVSATNPGPGQSWLNPQNGVLSLDPAEQSDADESSQASSSRQSTGVHMQATDEPPEMDKSVLHMDRPKEFTTSEPASRLASHAPGGGLAAATGSLAMTQQDAFTNDLDRATAGLSATHLEPSTATSRQRSATSPAAHGADSSTPKGTRASLPSPRPSPSSNPTSSDAAPQRKQSAICAAREAAADSTGVDSIFRLLPRETRPCIMAMMTIDPLARCTLSDLLEGRGKDALRCRCGGVECGGGMNTPPGTVTPPNEPEEGEAIDDGDDWLKSVACCSHPGGSHPAHDHVKIEPEEGPTKKKRMFFH